MRLLREYIRELLTEAAKGPEDLPEGIHVCVSRGSDNAMIYYCYGNGEQIGTGIEPGVSGYVNIAGPDFAGGGRLPCLGAWQVLGAGATAGWGPLLYDVAMETVGDAGLMADRGSLSDDAYNVWKYYLDSRPDVVKKQLDDEDNTLTPEEEDNCATDSTPEIGFIEWDTEVEDALIASPVMKVYSKEPTAIEKLKAMGRFKMT